MSALLCHDVFGIKMCRSIRFLYQMLIMDRVIPAALNLPSLRTQEMQIGVKLDQRNLL